MIRLRKMAEDYANLLEVGSEIIADTDGPYVRPFAHLLPALLFRRGLFLRCTDRGQIVVDSPPWSRFARERAGRVVCTKCDSAFFDCEHEAALIVGSASDPVLPWLGTVQLRAQS